MPSKLALPTPHLSTPLGMEVFATQKFSGGIQPGSRGVVAGLCTTPDSLDSSGQPSPKIMSESTAVFDSVKANERFQGATKGNEKQVRDKLQVTIQVPLDGGES